MKYLFNIIRFIHQRQKKIISFIYTIYAKKKATECGKGLKVNYRSFFGGKIYFGNNCNFNGMSVVGNGEVHFGNNFHSGSECLIITQNHNYDKGTKIPYDDTYERKKIIIEDNVWFGSYISPQKNRAVKNKSYFYNCYGKEKEYYIENQG